MVPVENDDNEATLRHRQLMGETPGPEHARQEAREGPNTQRRAPPRGRKTEARADEATSADASEASRDEAREPAPGVANRLSRPEGRPLDRRTSSL